MTNFEQFNNNERNGKSSMKLIIIAIIIILVVVVGIIIITSKNSTNDENLSSNNTNKISNSNNSSYDGTEELGSPVDFEIKQVTLPEKVGNEKNVKIDGNTWYYDLDAEGNAINVYVYGDFSGDVILPDTLDGHKVISIGNDGYGSSNTLFYNSSKAETYWDKITSITVPEGVKYINNYAFMGYENLEKIILPDSVIYIGDKAFSYSKNLAYINSNVEGTIIMPKNLQYYGQSLFTSNDKINSFEFPEQIDYIQNWTFSQTDGFTDLTISGQFKYIGMGAFSESSIENLTIDNGVQIIEHSAFSMNKQLTTVEIADSVVSIGSVAFQLCSSLNDFTYNGKLSYIGQNIFKYTKFEYSFKNSQLP